MPTGDEGNALAQRFEWYLADFTRFCALLDIRTKSGKKIPFRLNEIQKRYLKTRTPRDVILKPRQVGMTTLLVAYDVFRFLSHPGSDVMIVCQSMTSNAPISNITSLIRGFFESLAKLGFRLNFRTEKANEWVLKDRRLRVVVAGASEASATKVGRSGTVTLLHCTETSFWEYPDDTLNALLECVPPLEFGSEVVSESTANGASGYFYNQCQSAQSGSGYKLHFFPWYLQSEYRVPLEPGEFVRPTTDREITLAALGVTPEQLKWYRQKVEEKGQSLVDQEYPSDPETCFLVSGRGFFDQEATSRGLTKARDPIDIRKSGRIRIYAAPIAGESYITSLDCSEGIGEDPSGGLVYRRSTGEHVATIDGQFSPEDAAKEAVALCQEYNDALLVIERNNHGHSAINTAINNESCKYSSRLYIHDDKRPGWVTSPVTRPIMLDAFEADHRKGFWSTPDRGVMAQMRKFVIINGKPQAAPGEHDDLVLAAAIGWAVRQRPEFQYQTPPADLGLMF